MASRILRTLLVSGLALAAAAPAVAADLGAAPPAPTAPGADVDAFSLFQEFRLGGYAHNIRGKTALSPDPYFAEHGTVDVSFEALSSPMRLMDVANPWYAWFFNPRLSYGAMINTSGLTSYGFAGFNWRIPIASRFFGELEFGGAANTSPNPTVPTLSRLDIGCTVTFRESAGLGYQLTSNIDVVGNIEHISHADLCGRINPGLTDLGLRVGYKF